jgi:hypothetical protein
MFECLGELLSGTQAPDMNIRIDAILAPISLKIQIKFVFRRLFP